MLTEKIKDQIFAVRDSGAAFREGMPPTVMYTIPSHYLCHIYASELSG